MGRVSVVANRRSDRRRPYGDAGRSVLSHAAAAEAMREIGSWPGYSPTPLFRLDRVVRRIGVADVAYKDEGARFGLGSFKALGGAYGVCRVLMEEVRRRTGDEVRGRELREGRHRDIVRSVTVTCATDGNHGRSVAWGASLFGCGCVIYLPAQVSQGREAAITAFGARTVRVDGSYDAAVQRADEDARREGRIVVSDTSYAGYETIPRSVMQGYTVMVEEALEQLGGTVPTHLFLQAGVGGLAAAVAGHLWERYGSDRPTTILVEPEGAACLFETVSAGRVAPFAGELHTVMAGLACAEPSPLAWRILEHAADFAAVIPDELAEQGMRLLAAGSAGDTKVVAGESAVAGLMAAIEIADDAELRRAVGLGPGSRILLVGTEGATDPVIYERIVGATPARIAAV